MKHRKHTALSATAAIAAALALTAPPLAAQDAVAPTTTAPSMQAQPVTPPPADPVTTAPTIDIPDVTAEPAASGAGAEVTAPEPTVTTTETATTSEPTPATRSATRTTSSRTTTMSRTVAPVAAAPVAALPAPPAEDLAPIPTDTTVTPIAEEANTAVAPTPQQTDNVVGTLGVILLGLLALAILAAGLLFFRRRHPAMVEAETVPVTPRPTVEPAAAAPLAAEPTVTPMATSASYRRRDAAPVRGALQSNGAAVDLPATAPENYRERSALLDKMVAARPDKANPFTDRTQRLHRARLILQSLGRKFDREPLIDLSQYPNNWPELARQYHKAA